jgi:hypothetical protein
MTKRIMVHDLVTRIGPGFPPDGLALDLPNYKVVPGKGLRLTHVHPSQAGTYSCSLTSSIGVVTALTQGPML